MKVKTILILVSGLMIVGALLLPALAGAESGASTQYSGSGEYWYGGTADTAQYGATSNTASTSGTSSTTGLNSSNAAASAYGGSSLPNTGVPLLIPAVGMAAIGIGGLMRRMRNYR